MRIFVLFIILFTQFFFIHSANADGPLPISALTDHEPNYKGRELPHGQYVEVEVKGLKKSQVMWLNFDWLYEHGYYVPEQGLTPEFERQLLEALAYAVPGPKDDPALFNDTKKTMHSEAYGGKGLGLNKGSGRASSRGEVQIKGVGITSMVGPGQTYDHAHGGASLEEAMREAEWGEINHRELPYGSNRVIAILDTGTYTHWKDGTKEKRALIIREDPLRPAHLLAESTQKDLPAHLQIFFASLSKPGENLSLDEGAMRFYERIPKQFAAAHAKRLYHGAVNTSNFDLRGKWLDFGTETYLPSYQPIRVLKHKEAFGDSSQLYDQLIDPLLKSPLLPMSLKKKLTRTRFDQLYEDAITEEMLKLTGAPPELVKKLISKPEAQEFGKTILRFTRDEFYGPDLLMDKTIPNEMKKTRLGEIFKSGAQTGSIKSALTDSNTHIDLKEEMEEQYLTFMKSIHAEASVEGISKDALKHYMTHATEIIHRDPSSLMRPNMIEKDIQLVEEYEHVGNRSLIWNEIDHQIDSTNRNPYGKSPFEVIIESKPNHLKGTIERTVYNAKENKTREEVISIAKAYPVNPAYCDEPLAVLREMIANQKP